MPPVKALDRISEKWIRQSSTAQPEYEQGIQNPRRSWKDATMAAASNWAQGVQQAIADKRFEGGVAAVGDAGWSRATLDKGPARWAEGIRLAQSKYEAGFQPYRQVIESLNLPPRGPKGSPQNIKRVEVIALALHNKKGQLSKGRQ